MSGNVPQFHPFLLGLLPFSAGWGCPLLHAGCGGSLGRAWPGSGCPQVSCSRMVRGSHWGPCCVPLDTPLHAFAHTTLLVQPPLSAYCLGSQFTKQVCLPHPSQPDRVEFGKAGEGSLVLSTDRPRGSDWTPGSGARWSWQGPPHESLGFLLCGVGIMLVWPSQGCSGASCTQKAGGQRAWAAL